MKLITLLLALAAGLCAQNFSATTGDVSLSDAGTKFTIQQPASGARQVRLIAAVVFCSVACDLSQSQNGTAATATAGTATALPPSTTAATATVWTGSNVGNGTAAGGLLHLSAGQTMTLDMSLVRMGVGGTSTNYTFAIASLTGTVNVTVYWAEQ